MTVFPMIPKRQLSICVGAVLVCLVAACSRSNKAAQTESSTAPIDPCSVLSPGDIQTALGAAPKAAGKRDNMSVTDDCGWTLPSGADVHVTFFNPTGAAALYTPQVSSRQSRDKTYDSVSGVGDQAVYRDDSSPAIHVSESVEVVKDKRHFDLHYVDVLTNGGGPPKDAMVSLARTVLAHTH